MTPSLSMRDQRDIPSTLTSRKAAGCLSDMRTITRLGHKRKIDASFTQLMCSNALRRSASGSKYRLRPKSWEKTFSTLAREAY